MIYSKTEETINCKAMYGHLYNLEDGKRIVFDDNSSWELKGEYGQPKEEILKTKDIDVLKREVEKDDTNYRELFKRGTKLYFFLTKQLQIFEFELLEELYVKLDNKNKYSIYPHCLCQTIYSDIPFFEVLSGRSLLELYRKTSVLYNGLKTSHTTYVLRHFYTDSRCSENYSLRMACEKIYRDERIEKARASLKEKLEELNKLKI